MSAENKRDPYEVLGLNKNVSQDEIKRTYRQLAKKWHPDLNPDNKKEAEEKFKEINEAYELLSDKDKRARYDQFGWAGVDPSHGFGGAPGGGGFDDIFGGGGGFGGFDDIFSSIFGGRSRGGARRQVQRVGSDIEMQIELGFEEAVFGVEKEIQVKRKVPCGECNGTGAEAGTKPEKCSRCQGRGQVTQTSRSAFGLVQQILPCPDCRGRGEIIKKKCQTCKGTGIVNDIDTIKFRIPPGLPDEGVVIPMEGKGNLDAAGGMPGDLQLVVRVKDHPVFQRDGKLLIRDVTVDYVQLVTGADVPITTLDGKTIKLKIPAGTKPGQTLRVEGYGVPIFRDPKGIRGDLFVNVQCAIPKLKDLPREEQDMLEQLAAQRAERMQAEAQQREDEVKKSIKLPKKGSESKENKASSGRGNEGGPKSSPKSPAKGQGRSSPGSKRANQARKGQR